MSLCQYLHLVVNVNQIKRARYCLQVTLRALYRKLTDIERKEESTLAHFDHFDLYVHTLRNLFEVVLCFGPFQLRTLADYSCI